MRGFPRGRVMRWWIVIAAAGLVLLCGLSNSIARMKELSAEEELVYKNAKVSVICVANTQQRVHRVNRAGFCVTNWGFFGSESSDLYESPGGCFKPNPESGTDKAESFEYPIGSSLSYLFQGGLWIGAIVPSDNPEHPLDTLVSLACDGWHLINELYPDGPAPAGAIIERTIRPTIPNMQYIDACTSTQAISEQDIISKYDDLKPECVGGADPNDKRLHLPFGVSVTQKSYAWSYSYAEDFFLMDFWLKNVNTHGDTIKDIYVGIYIDADVGHVSEAAGGSQDDITGFLDTLRNPVDPTKLDSIKTAWIADNDGFPVGKGPDDYAGAFMGMSCTGVSGVRVIRTPPAPADSATLPDSLLFGTWFNWWVSNQSGGDKDWGPWKQKNQRRWQDRLPYNGTCPTTFPDNVTGTPGGDISKYFIMSNREWDYDQIFSKQDRTSDGWLPPSASEGDALSQGYDTRYLFSFGPILKLAPGDSVPVTLAYVAGENFHVKPYNRKQNLPDKPDEFKRNLDFSDLATNSRWAGWVYDNPDSNGYQDGVPDFKGPPPPPSPMLSLAVKQGEVTMSWNGKETEHFMDQFTTRKDFEGYRVYVGEARQGADYFLLHSADKIDFQLWKFNPTSYPPKFEYKFASTPPESLQHWFWSKVTNLEAVFDSIKAHSDDSSAFTCPSGSPESLIVGKNSDEKIKITSGDRLYFRQQDWNTGFNGIAKYPAYRDSVDEHLVTDTLDRYWDYEYTVRNLLPSRQMSFAVTAFDYGNPSTKLDPLESSKSINQTDVYPISSPEEVKAGGKKVVIYPNPYRIDGGYVELGFEDPDKSGFREAADRRLWLVNLPVHCMIRIYTLDGDLVIEKEHDGRGLTNPTLDYWNLISRNTQAVVSGLYLFSVEDLETGENQIGKFVIIK